MPLESTPMPQTRHVLLVVLICLVAVVLTGYFASNGDPTETQFDPNHICEQSINQFRLNTWRWIQGPAAVLLVILKLILYPLGRVPAYEVLCTLPEAALYCLLVLSMYMCSTVLGCVPQKTKEESKNE